MGSSSSNTEYHSGFNMYPGETGSYCTKNCFEDC